MRRLLLIGIGNSPDARANVADSVGCLPSNYFPFFVANRMLILLGGNMILSHDDSLSLMIFLEVGMEPSQANEI